MSRALDSKAFGAVQALYQVDFEVQAGEIMALVGDNGAGKSTMIKGVTGQIGNTVLPFQQIAAETLSSHGVMDEMAIMTFTLRGIQAMAQH